MIHGSRAYGLATETPDTDLRGVFVPAGHGMPCPYAFAAQPDQVGPAKRAPDGRAT